jgi:hypothetical protein
MLCSNLTSTDLNTLTARFCYFGSWQ